MQILNTGMGAGNRKAMAINPVSGVQCRDKESSFLIIVREKMSESEIDNNG